MNELTDFDIARLLSDSLKYVRLYRNHTVVVKYGGNAMKNPELQQQVMHDLVLLSMIGIRIVLVHGGGPSINKSLAALGIESKFVRGLRVTDVGHITGVDVSIVETLLEKGCIPVIASVAGDGEGRSYNVNADTAAAAIAGALGARRLVLMTDINGLMRDVKDPDSLISVLTTEDIGPLKEQGVISGGMIPKIDCALHAIESGVERVAMINGTLPHSILVEMLTKGGIGTLVKTGPRTAASA